MAAAAPPLSVTGASLAGERVGVRCEGGRIVALGPEVRAESGDLTIEAEGAPLVAPLVNGHTHAAMTLFRGFAGDLPLMRWLREKVWPVEERLEAEDVYWGARLACLEMIRTGTVRFWDMYWHPQATGRAALDAGLRATIGAPLIDLESDPAMLRDAALGSLDELAELGPAIAPAIAPHAIYTVSEASLRWIAELSRERRLPVQIHLSETEEEVDDCLAAHGVRPAAYLDRVGFLDERTVLSHGVWLDRAELELIAERGCTVVTNPVANMKLGVGGVFPYPAAREAGVAVGLGTDGAGSNDSLDLLADLKAFALAQRHAAGDATVIGAEEAWAVATGTAAPLLTATTSELHQILHPAGGKIDAVRVGGPADFLLLRPHSYELGLGDLHSDLVYAASGSVVDTTVVAGRVLMRGGEVEGSEEVVAQAAERAARLGLS